MMKRNLISIVFALIPWPGKENLIFVSIFSNYLQQTRKLKVLFDL